MMKKGAQAATAPERGTKEEQVPSEEELKRNARACFDELLSFCEQEHPEGSLRVERSVREFVFRLACLCLELLLAHAHGTLRYDRWLESGKYKLKPKPVARTLKTVFGPVRYWRCYLEGKKRKGTRGFYPLDAVLGLPGDGFTPHVMSLCACLATRMSFGAARCVFAKFFAWCPSSEAIECVVLGLGRVANEFMEQQRQFADDGEVLVCEVDGKATPTATQRELRKRRGKRKKKHKLGCTCQRHRGGKRLRRTRKKNRDTQRRRRNKGDKSKNGRSITLACMYTLRMGPDGSLCGPINKRVWGSYAPRHVMFSWIRREATRRGFDPESGKRVHFVMDGEVCLRKGLAELFRGATFSLDIQHVQEKLWDVGRTFHKEGTDELEAWVDERRAYLYSGQAEELLADLKALRQRLSKRAKRDGAKRKALREAIRYMSKRLDMMRYRDWLEEDLPIASGIIEGAVRYVIGERMDCSGMRWIPGRAEALLHLRCIELNGDWEDFIQWDYGRRRERLLAGNKNIVRTKQPINISRPNYMNHTELDDVA